MKSTLSLAADRSIQHLRWSKDADGWGGDEDVVLTVLDADLLGRVEWIEGIGDRWNVWIFEEIDILPEDILLIDALALALSIERVGNYTTLRTKEFHHFEIVAGEHELTVDQLVAQIP